MGCSCQVTTKKLASCTGSINRIAASIPKTLYMNLYYTLFESYITYGITVWGSIPNRKFNAQKKILRVLFGDKEKFLDKFRQWRNDRPCYPCYAGGGTLGGRHITKLTVF